MNLATNMTPGIIVVPNLKGFKVFAFSRGFKKISRRDVHTARMLSVFYHLIIDGGNEKLELFIRASLTVGTGSLVLQTLCPKLELYVLGFRKLQNKERSSTVMLNLFS